MKKKDDTIIMVGNLYMNINMLKDVAKMTKKGLKHSAEARAWCDGAEYAYNVVMRMIEEMFEDGVDKD